jgi:hypothetical protein
MKHSFRVILDLPSGVSLSEMRHYIEEAIKTSIGQLPPEDPLFYLDRSSVKVVIGD